jgi:HSP20 family protein
MATQQGQNGGTSQQEHSGGNATQAPESGALGVEQPGQGSERNAGSSSSSQEQNASRAEPRASQAGSVVPGKGRAAMAGPRLGPSAGPLALMRRFSEDMDRMFEGFFGPGLFGRDPFGSLAQSTRWPQIEVHQEGNRWIVQADVPGLRREDVNVEVRDDQLVISGERRNQSESNEGGYYRTERTYGTFVRSIPLPEGANLESASASFEQGVLRVEIEVPEEQQRSRRIEVREGSPQ